MKIFLNKFLYTNNAIQKPKDLTKTFGDKQISFKSQLDDDAFKPGFDDETIYQATHGNDIRNEQTKEIIMESYAAYCYFARLKEALSEKAIKQKYTASTINQAILSRITPQNREKITTRLKTIGAFDDKQKLTSLFNLYSRISKKDPDLIFGYDLLDVCTQVNDYNEILNFYSLLTFANIQNGRSGNGSKAREILNFMKKIGIKNETAFFDRYAYLAKDYDNFSNNFDKFYAYEYVKDTYEEKMGAVRFIASFIQLISKVNPDEFYKKYGKILDYLYDKQKNTFVIGLTVLMSYLALQKEDISPNALKVMASLEDTKTTKGQYELYIFLIEENIDIEELNKLTKAQYISDINMADVVVNRNEQIENLMGQLNLKYSEARRFYINFAQTINAINNCKDDDKETTSLFALLYATSILEIKNEKELIKLYQTLTNKNKDKKFKKKNNDSDNQITQKELLEFINQLSFIDSKMAQMHKKEKSYQLLIGLKNKKAEFEKISPRLEKLIDEKHARYLCRNSFFIFLFYHDLYNKNYGLNVFIDKVIEARKNETKGKETTNFRFNKLLEFFKDENVLEEFLIKNSIYLDDESDNHSSVCLKVLDILFKDKSDKELKELCEKLAKTDFIKNSKNSFAGYISSKSDEEISIIFNIALSEDFKSINEFSKLISPYVRKQKKIGNILKHYSEQDISFREYIQKIAQIQKELDNIGFDIKINNENIEAITSQDLKERKLSINRITELSKKLLGLNEETNFLCGLNNSLSTVKQQHSPNKIAQEITYSKIGKYNEEYCGFIKEFSLNEFDTILDSFDQQKYQSALANEFKNNLKYVCEFINSNSWLPKFADNKVPNLCLHAKMRLIDRFILQENKDLFSDATTKELKEILNTVYTSTPHKIEKSNSASALYFRHQDYEIKAVFNPTGEMITIAKNKL